MIQAGLESNGQTVMVQVQKQLEILLPSNPTTGYMWVEVRTTDLQNLRLDSSDLITDGSVKQYGKGGHQRWLFTAVSPGQSNILFQYQQPWDETTVDQTFFLTVAVTE
ncbi:protease inhibitor I42 family protein [Bacillus cabrialesii]|uniref:protease inhibitor I42 family protein n=1 Tax=Bacillus cabrialesii TaxID=2487276 RepID=UPI0010111220|nr:protease inhibitor I42 family protein [Bacillus cabrialesii]UQE80252.1 protease inhibitor I42 family protein [Bacillus cabrialesii]